MNSNLKNLFKKAAWAPIGVVLFHAGVAVLFGHRQSLDPLMHFLGGVAMAFFLHNFVSIWSDWFGNPKKMARYLIVFSLTCSVALFWEFLEFSGGTLMGVYTQLSLRETMGDLFFGCIGALVYLGSSHFLGKRK